VISLFPIKTCLLYFCLALALSPRIAISDFDDFSYVALPANSHQIAAADETLESRLERLRKKALENLAELLMRGENISLPKAIHEWFFWGSVGEGFAKLNASGKMSTNRASGLIEKAISQLADIDPKGTIKRAIKQRQTRKEIAFSPCDYEPLYLANLNIALGGLVAVNKGRSQYSDLHREVTHFLVDLTSSARFHNIRGMGCQSPRRPFEQAAVFYSIDLYNRAYGAQLLKKEYTEWRTNLEKTLSHPDTGLPYSDIENEEPPRGSTTGMLIYYLTQLHDPYARKIWPKYMIHFKHELSPWGLFRVSTVREYLEYLPDSVKKADDLSGPILFKSSTRGTGAAILASLVLGDKQLHEDIDSIREFIDWVPSWYDDEYAIDAILLNGVPHRIYEQSSLKVE
jgi:hypothetical protein